MTFDLIGSWVLPVIGRGGVWAGTIFQSLLCVCFPVYLCAALTRCNVFLQEVELKYNELRSNPAAADPDGSGAFPSSLQTVD